MTRARPAPARRPILPATLLLLAILLFTALGIWQVERRRWKLDLIAAVDARIHAPPQAPPGPAGWQRFDAKGNVYRHVTIAGTYLHDRETLVQAATALGQGYWVLTPLRTPAGWLLLVNRGFVPADRKLVGSRRAGQVAGTVRITGLLRVSEPHGGFLRSNDPAAGRWYSRDVAAIARSRGLKAAPYFLDADAAPNPGGLPGGGLTVVSFPNNHLVYALTWFSLALLSCFGLVKLLRTPPGYSSAPEI